MAVDLPLTQDTVIRVVMRLIIDTDTAGDDTFSILLALRHPSVTLEALTICNGNVDFEQQVENALVTLEMAGKGGSVPVYRGCARPMHREPVDASDVFGKDGMGDGNFPRARQRAEEKHAVDEIIERVMASPGEITILAQAPLTNIATAYQREPRIAQAVRHLWIMGGTHDDDGNITPTAEFNFYVDPEAARIVFNAGFRTTLSTWTLTMKSGLLTAEDLTEIDRMDTRLSRFFMKVNEATLAWMKEHQGVAVSTHPNSLTCACMIDESLILDAAECIVEVETEDDRTRGHSRVFPVGPCGRVATDAQVARRAPNARVIGTADKGKFSKMLREALA